MRTAGRPDHAFRADVQGARAIAVLLVVLYHAGVPYLTGGFVGVDVFFVVSGFVITGLLAREAQATGRIDLMAFFARRIRRLLPAALTMLGAVLLAAAWLYPPSEQRSVISAAAAATAYVANFWFADRAIDYLRGEADDNPLLHMWSLGVEEQFYLFWPLLIGALARRSLPGALQGRLRWWVGAIAALSLAGCIGVTWTSQAWAFFMMPWRAWEFGLGAMVWLLSRRSAELNAAATRLLGTVGVAMVLGAAFALDRGSLFPGAWALLPAAGTALVIAACGVPRPSRLKTLLAHPLMVRLGDLSYSWYLWHWPLLVYAEVLWPGSVAGRIAGIAVSLLIAQLSLRFIETPFRMRSLQAPVDARRVVVATAALTCGLLLSLGLLETLRAQRGSNHFQQLLAKASRDVPALRAKGCHAGFRATEPVECVGGSDHASAPLLVVVGDSHAAQWYPAFESLAMRRGWRLVSMTKSACPSVDVEVFLPVFKRSYRECEKWRQAVMQRLETMRPALVILANSSRYPEVDAWEAGFARTVSGLADRQIAVASMRDTPWPGFDVPRCLARAEHRGRDLDEACGYARDQALAHGLSILEAERRGAARAPLLGIIDMTAAICPAERCTVYASGIVRFVDAHHLSATYARTLVAALEAEVAPLLERATGAALPSSTVFR